MPVRRRNKVQEMLREAILAVGTHSGTVSADVDELRSRLKLLRDSTKEQDCAPADLITANGAGNSVHSTHASRSAARRPQTSQQAAAPRTCCVYYVA